MCMSIFNELAPCIILTMVAFLMVIYSALDISSPSCLISASSWVTVLTQSLITRARCFFVWLISSAHSPNGGKFYKHINRNIYSSNDWCAYGLPQLGYFKLDLSPLSTLIKAHRANIRWNTSAWRRYVSNYSRLHTDVVLSSCLVYFQSGNWFYN